MRKRPILLAAAVFAAGVALLVFFAGNAHAQSNTAQQTVSYQVLGVNRIAVAGSPALVVNTAAAGSDLTQASDNSATYSFTTNQNSQKITASLSSNMPTGLTLRANFSVSGTAGEGTSAGAQALSTSSVDVVTGISRAKVSGRTLTYTLDATVQADLVETPATATVTYTLTSGS